MLGDEGELQGNAGERRNSSSQVRERYYLLADTGVTRRPNDVLVALVPREFSETVTEGDVLNELGVVLGHSELLREKKWL